MIEKDCILKFKKGSSDAFERLYMEYHMKLFNFVMKLTSGNAAVAKDIVQDTFVRLWEARKTVDENRDIRNYIFTIAKNILSNRYSHLVVEYIHKEYVLSDSPVSECTAERVVDGHLLEETLLRVVASMPPVRRRVYSLSRLHGLSHKEIAELLNISTSTVETHLSKADGYVREHLGANNYS